MPVLEITSLVPESTHPPSATRRSCTAWWNRAARPSVLLLMLAVQGAPLIGGAASISISRPVFDADFVSTATDVFKVEPSEACRHLEEGLTAPSEPPSGFALLIGVDEVGDIWMGGQGPANDVALLGAELELLGYEVTRLINPTRPAVVEALAAILEKARCQDFVFLSYSGLRVSLPGAFLAGETIGLAARELQRQGQSPMVVHQDNTAWVLPTLTNELRADLERDASVDLAHVRTLDKYATLTARARANEHILPPDLIAGFVLALAKKGVHAVVLSDAGRDEELHLSTAFGRPTASRFTRSSFESPHSGVISDEVYAGRQLYIYGARAGAEVKEGRFDGRDIDLGYATYAFVTALRRSATGSADELSVQMREFYATDASGLSLFVIESSHPTLPMFLDRQASSEVEIGELSVAFDGLGRTDTRGVVLLQQPMVQFDGIIDDHRQATGVIVDDQLFPAVDNRFRADLKATPATKELSIIAIFKNGELAQRTVPVFYAGDLEGAFLDSPPYALLIANWDYESTGASSVWQNLTSPPRDIASVGKILIEKFGFRTTIEMPGGQVESLVLRNATARDVESKLYALQKALKPDDRLLIYYAGHGQFLEGQPFWIPVDGEDENHYSWLDADKLTYGLKSMKAQSVLVVSDSCFSGAFAGDTKAAEKLASLVRQNLQNREQHKASLLEYAKHRSRQVITSGALKPVADTGQTTEGLSPFAYQFARSLEALHESHLSFSEDDLYYYLRMGVIGNEELLKQTPLEGNLAEAGHDPKGSFVFVGAREPEPTEPE